MTGSLSLEREAFQGRKLSSQGDVRSKGGEEERKGEVGQFESNRSGTGR